uniref:Solute carrier family 40 protein n=1 Tax=Caenorhabditis tropicalis TaxID=1561998 RepID=A0A1I7U9E0_9PELO
MYNTGLWITNSTAVSLLIERWLATRRSSSYEQEPVKTGIMMAILQNRFVSRDEMVLTKTNVNGRVFQ